MQTSDKGLNVIRSFEGRALRAYQDSVGVWTIGYGNTNFDANAVKELGKIGRGLTITADQAETLFVESIRHGYEPAVSKRLAPLGVALTQGTYDAGSSFHYNCGAIMKATWPTALIQGDKSLARTSILSWNKAKGTVLPGLTRRRKREWSMIDIGDYGPEGASGPVDLDTHKQLPAPRPAGAGPLVPFPTPEATNSAVPGQAKTGDVSDHVAEVNGYLVALGRLKKMPEPSSLFTKETEDAVLKYQGEHPNLTKDGKVGPATTASLQRDVKMRQTTKKTTKVTAIVASAGTAAAAAGWATIKFVLIAAGVAGSAGLIFIVLTHKTELETLWNALRGKQVP
jgi:lysozyme